MIYERTFWLQAAHFNSQLSYDCVWALAKEPGTKGLRRDEALSLCRDVHGHNFRITVMLEGDPVKGKSPWLVDDVQLAQVVMEWDNTNISLHPDFMGPRWRATTELMAHVLYAKLWDVFGPIVRAVTVNETHDISATVESRDD